MSEKKKKIRNLVERQKKKEKFYYLVRANANSRAL